MLDPDLISLIKQKLSEGIEREKILKIFVEKGYSSEEVEEVFKSYYGAESSQGNNLKTDPVMPEMPNFKEPSQPGFSEVAVPVGEVVSDKSFPSEGRTKKPFFKKAIVLLSIILASLILVGGVGAFVYTKFAKIDPVSLLPQETSFYVRINMDSQGEQVKNLKENLNKFPYYERLSEKVSDEFEKMKIREPILKNLDFSISKELILAGISPISEKNIDSPSFVLILVRPDLKKIEGLTNDLKIEIEKDNYWKFEQEDYRGRTIIKVLPKTPSEYSNYGSPEQFAAAYTNGQFVITFKTDDIKKVIDVAADKEIKNVFKKNKIKSIDSSITYKKLEKYLPSEYLALLYGELDLSEILKTTEGVSSNLQGTDKSLISLTASLQSVLDNLPFLKGKNIENSEKVAFAGVILADKNEIKMKSYSLDLRKDAFSAVQFSFNDSLAGFLPEKIGNQEIVFYGEGKDLEASFGEIEKAFTQKMTSEEKKDFDDAMEFLRKELGFDIKEDIVPLFGENYALFLSSDPAGKEMPIISIVSAINDEAKTKENLLKVKLPSIGGSINQSRNRAKDAALMGNMSSMRAEAEMIWDNDGGYANVNCKNKEIVSLCENIKTQAGNYPTIKASTQSYCAYINLTQQGMYYCVDSIGTAVKTDINPGGKGYCTSYTFTCPKAQTSVPSVYQSPETVGFTKETADGFEVYSLPLYDKFGLYFSVKDNKLIFTPIKESLVSILKGLSDSSQKKLKDSQLFTEQFKSIPSEVSSISYIHPYGLIGFAKYFAGFAFDNFGSSVLSYMVPQTQLKDASYRETVLNTISEFLDKGIAPYLKVLKVESAYSYSLDNGLTASEGKLVIEELSSKEKKDTEDFWDNIENWVKEKSALLLPSYYGNKTYE